MSRSWTQDRSTLSGAARAEFVQVVDDAGGDAAQSFTIPGERRRADAARVDERPETGLQDPQASSRVPCVGSSRCRTLRHVRAIRRFTVRTVLPEPIAALGELAINLRWSWHRPTQELFASVDPARWAATRHDPLKLLGALVAGGARRPRRRHGFVARVDEAAEDLQRVPDRAAVVPGAQRRRRRPRSPTSRPSSGSPRCCRSTPAASASSRATT